MSLQFESLPATRVLTAAEREWIRRQGMTRSSVCATCSAATPAASAAVERVDQLVLGHRGAAGDAGVLRALVELVAAERGEIAVARRPAVAVAATFGRSEALFESGHEIGHRGGLLFVIGDGDALALLLALDDVEQALAVV